MTGDASTSEKSSISKMKWFLMLVCIAFVCQSVYFWYGSRGDADETKEINETTAVEEPASENPIKAEADFYTFSVKDMAGNDYSLENYRGYVTLIVNVASECAYTDSTYKDLVKLQDKYEPTGVFTVLGFPSNQFYNKEPGTNEEILRFANEKYQVNFPLFGKTDVIGENAPEAWTFLSKDVGFAPEGNFYKYLVDHNSRVVDVWKTTTPAIDLDYWIEQAVGRAMAAQEAYVKNNVETANAGHEGEL